MFFAQENFLIASENLKEKLIKKTKFTFINEPILNSFGKGIIQKHMGYIIFFPFFSSAKKAEERIYYTRVTFSHK